MKLGTGAPFILVATAGKVHAPRQMTHPPELAQTRQRPPAQVAVIAGNFARAINPHPYPTDFVREIRIQWMWILAGSVTSLIDSEVKGQVHNKTSMVKSHLLAARMTTTDTSLTFTSGWRLWSAKNNPPLGIPFLMLIRQTVYFIISNNKNKHRDVKTDHGIVTAGCYDHVISR